jgi:putative ABC transport system ATP-binding protein
MAVCKPVVELAEVRKAFALGENHFLALDGVDLRIENNEFVSITGPSGSGKSTLMNILGCLATPTSGCYRLRGRDVASMGEGDLASVRNRSVGFIFQNFNLLPRLSSVENVALPLRFRLTPAAERCRRAKEALDMVGLSERANHVPNQLSGGQRQRVAIARALVIRPALLLADEPTGNLDSRTTEQIMQLFELLHRSGQTIVLVTHEPDISARCLRRIELVDGRIRSDSAAQRAPGEAREDRGFSPCPA